MTANIALIGFGEAGSTFARAARWEASAFDILAERKPDIANAGLRACDTAAEALAEAEIVLSLVTADQALTVAQEDAPLLKAGAIWCDMNSVAPATKQAAAVAIEAAGGRYVDVAILAPVHPARLKVPLLVSGPAAGEAHSALNAAGFQNVRKVGAEIGQASSIKMIRSIMVKGIEALTDEMMAAAEAAGVTEEVLSSLDDSEKIESWTTRAAYNLERMTNHGSRRAAEMEEVAKTLTALNVEPLMTRGTVIRQRDAATRGHQRSDAA